ncbi:MAG: hypothetical protein AB7Q17_10760 [Phycisphaerae bacterium]
MRTAQARHDRRGDTTAVGRTRARGFISLVVLLAMLSIVYLCIVISRLVILEIAQEHRARLESAADQIVESARDWVARHGATLAAGHFCELPVDELTPAGVSALAELARPGAGESDVDSLVLRLSLRTGRLRVTRSVGLPLPRAPQSAPAPTQ